MATVKPIPDGYHTVTPYLIVKGASQFIAFLQKAFDAKVNTRMDRPDGKLWHADLTIGDSRVMLSDATEQFPANHTTIFLYVQNTDATYKRALDAGAMSIMKPANQFYGDRMGGVKDHFGNQWWIGTHVEDVSPEEVQRRQQAQMNQQQQQA